MNGLRDGWPQRVGPLPKLRARHQLERGQLPRWADHPRRYRTEDGRWRYVAEPYQLDADALADLAWLTEYGWDVTVTAWEAEHAPGDTLAVTIERGAA